MFFFYLILGLTTTQGEPLRPCCLNDGSCFDLTEALCTTVGGSVSKASSCAEAQCEAVGACCTSGLMLWIQNTDCSRRMLWRQNPNNCNPRCKVNCVAFGWNAG